MLKINKTIEDMLPITVPEVNVQSINNLCNTIKSIKLFIVPSHVISVVTDISVYGIDISVQRI